MLKDPRIVELIQKIEEREDIQDEMKRVFADYLKTLPVYDYRSRGICFYYILRIILKAHQHYETTEARRYYDKMVAVFRLQNAKYKEKLKHRSQLKTTALTRISNFYRMMERFFSSLEVLYDKKDFLDATRRAYEEKMHYRKHHFLFQGKRWRYCEYFFLDLTSKYGDSFFRWGVTALLFALIMAGLYFLFDLPLDLATRMVQNGHWYDYIYFSIVTLTTLGYGDIVPITPLAKFFVSIEVFFGYIMLGIFVNLIQKKL